MMSEGLKLMAVVVCFSILLASCAGLAEEVALDDAPRPGESKTAPLPGGSVTASPPGGFAAAGGSKTAPLPGGLEATPAYPKKAVPHKVESECLAAGLDQSVLLSQFGQGGSTHLLSAIDPLSGRALCDFPPIAAGLNVTLSLSPDGHTLAMVVSRQHDHSDGALHLVDLEQWQAVETTVDIRDWVSQMAFSADGRYLAIAYMDPEAGESSWPSTFVLDLVDVTSQQRVAATTLSVAPRLMEFTPDGEALMAYGVANQDGSGIDAQAYALLLDTTNLEVTWELALEGVRDGQTRLYGSDGSETYVWWGPAAVLSAERQALYIVHADEDKLTTADFARRSAKAVEIRPQLSWIERWLALTAGVAHAKVVDGTSKQAVLSTDGQRLYIVGQNNDTWQDENGYWQFTQTPLGLQVVDAASGREIAHMDTEASQLALSHDGGRLFLHGWSQSSIWTEVVDLERMEIETRLTGRQVVPARRLNGEPVLLAAINNGSAQTVLAALDAGTLEEINRWWVWGYAQWVGTR